MKKIIKIVVLLILLMSFGNGYCKKINEAWPYTWENTKDIKVYIPEHYARGITKIGFNYWTEVSDNKITFKYVDNKEDAQINVVYVNSIPGTAIGLCSPTSVDAGKKFKKVQIEIAEHNEQGKRLATHWLIHISRHEMAHALGLSHNDNVRSAIGPQRVKSENLDRDYDRKLLYEIYNW